MDRTNGTARLKQGTYRFDDFYYQRMYGPNGYYRNGNGVGVDFSTFVADGPALAKRIGIWLDEKWRQQKYPKPFNIYEMAAGDGTLCRQILSLPLKCASSIRYTAVETNKLYQHSFPANVQVVQSIPNGPISGVIIGNELLDVQPFRFVSYRNHSWRELYVKVGEQCSYDWQPIAEKVPSSLEAIKIKTGSAPWIQQTADLLHKASANFTGHMLMIDYANMETIEMPGTAWFIAIRDGYRVPALDVLCRSDLSANVPIDQLAELFYPPKVTPQWVWLDYPVDPSDKFFVMEWKFSNGEYTMEGKL